MSGNLLTIVTRIKQGEERTLREFLRTHADPRYDAQTLLRCKPKFQFHKLIGLHFCSFVILGADRSFDPCLVFEATFDGPKTDFIRALLQIAGPGMHEVYQHCEGYPVSGQILPNVTEEYLLKHDVGAHAVFSGCPGVRLGRLWRRTVYAVMSSRTWRRCGDGWVASPLPSTQCAGNCRRS